MCLFPVHCSLLVQLVHNMPLDQKHEAFVIVNATNLVIHFLKKDVEKSYISRLFPIKRAT